MKMQPLPQTEHYVSWTCWVLWWWLKNYWFFKAILVQHSAKACQSHRIQVQLSYQINCIENQQPKERLRSQHTWQVPAWKQAWSVARLGKNHSAYRQDGTGWYRFRGAYLLVIFLWNLWHASVIFSWHLFSGDNILVTSWSFFWTGRVWCMWVFNRFMIRMHRKVLSPGWNDQRFQSWCWFYT